MHGGIGFTWEHPAHLYLKRAKASAVTFGTPGAHRAALAGLVNLPAPVLAVGSAAGRGLVGGGVALPRNRGQVVPGFLRPRRVGDGPVGGQSRRRMRRGLARLRQVAGSPSRERPGTARRCARPRRRACRRQRAAERRRRTGCPGPGCRSRFLGPGAEAMPTTMTSQKARQITATMTIAQISAGVAVVFTAKYIAGPLTSTTREVVLTRSRPPRTRPAVH